MSEQSAGLGERIQRLYHQFIPDTIRFPLGRARRTMLDGWIRATGGHGPLPPRRVLQRVQLTPWVMEYIEVGARGAETVRRELIAAGLDEETPQRVLDFGCGLGRTLRHLRSTSWQLAGCDVDGDSIAWTRRALPSIPLEANPPRPPLPYADHSFDALYAISVFTHFGPAEQSAWAEELARVLCPGGLALITTMGPWAFHPFPPSPAGPNTAEPNTAEPDTVESNKGPDIDGFWFFPVGGGFNNSAAVHTKKALQTIFSPWFEPLGWKKQGLDGFQDLSLFRARSSAGSGESGEEAP